MTAEIEIPTGAATTQAGVTVTDPGDAAAAPGDATPIEGDVLYLGYVDQADDLDLYSFDPTPLAQVAVRLSHLAGDGDLVVYGPAQETAADAPSPAGTSTIVPPVPPQGADDLDVPGAAYAPEPDTDGGVPVLAGQTVVGRSAARGTDLEAVGDGYISVTPLQLDLTHHASIGTLAESYAA